LNFILIKYITKKFTGLFFLCILSVIMLYLVLDGIENMDKFIDRKVPFLAVLTYYLYYIPFISVLTLPVATLMATVFSIIGMARGNEIVALKSLGFSLYQTILPLLSMGLLVAVLSFFLAELVVSETTRKKEQIEQKYLYRSKRNKFLSRFNNMQIKDENSIISIGRFDLKKKIALRVKIETFENSRLVYRLDTDSMSFVKDSWIVNQGYERYFKASSETYTALTAPVKFSFHFNPEELIQAQGSPEQMPYSVLKRNIARIQRSGGETAKWLTELHIRIGYPFSNFLIVLFSVPLVYNRRKQNAAIGFGISLTIVFFYFGIVKMGQTMGQNGSLHPLLAAWLGNLIMGVGGLINLIKTRK